MNGITKVKVNIMLPVLNVIKKLKKVQKQTTRFINKEKLNN